MKATSLVTDKEFMVNPRNPCVYTVLSGAYEILNEQPAAARSNIPFICLTDNPHLRSDSWQIVQVPLRFAMDPIRSQRLLKIFPYDVAPLQAYDASIYIDNTVCLHEPPEKLIETLVWSSGIGLPLHSYRETVHDEFIEVARLGFDDQGRIFEQLNHYLANEPAPLDEKPFWTAILLRDHGNARVRGAMAAWRDHVMRYSRRDQLSANHAFAATGVQPDGWEIDNFRSWFHTWPHAPGRDRFAGPRDPQRSAQPVHTQLRAALVSGQAQQLELRQLRDDLARAQREADLFAESASARSHLLNDLEARYVLQSGELDAAHSSVATLQSTSQSRQEAMQSLQQTLELQQQELERLNRQLVLERRRSDAEREELVQRFLRSTSWRLTGPLRRLSRLLRSQRPSD